MNGGVASFIRILVYGVDCKIGEKAAISVNGPPEVDAVMRSLWTPFHLYLSPFKANKVVCNFGRENET